MLQRARTWSRRGQQPGDHRCALEHGGTRGLCSACLPPMGSFACLQRAVLPDCKPHSALGRTQVGSHEDDSTCFLLSKPPACVRQRWPSQGKKCGDSKLPIPIHPHPQLWFGVWHWDGDTFDSHELRRAALSHALPRSQRGCVRWRAAEQQRALRRKQASKDLDNKNKHEAIKRRMGDVVWCAFAKK